MNKEKLNYTITEITQGHYNIQLNNTVYYDVNAVEIMIIKQLEHQLEVSEQKRLKAIEYIKSNPPIFMDEFLIDVECVLENECTDEYVGEIRFISKLLEILEGDE